jgi:hypothetical protein
MLGDRSGRGKERERGRRDALHEPAPADDAPPVAAIGDMTDDEHQRDRGQELREPDEAEVERAPGELVDLPAHRDGLHLVGEYRADPRKPVLPERAMLENGRGGGRRRVHVVGR